MRSSGLRRLDIWTDGACSGNPGPGGYAAVILYDSYIEYRAGYSPDTTNNRMELTGMINALEMALIGIRTGVCSSAIIHTDSKYIENAINCGWLKKWVKNDFSKIKNSDLWKEINLLLHQSDDISIKWVKGHSGIDGNTIADELATEALLTKRNSIGTIKL